MKDNIKDIDKLWNKLGSIDSIYERTRVYNSDINTEISPLGTSDDATRGKFDSNMLGVADTSKLGG